MVASALPFRRVVPSPESVRDAELVHRYNQGDDLAFVEIVSRHRKRVHSVALHTLRNHADADEITQDTFIRAHRCLANFRGDSALSTWLHRIAVNLSLNRRKHHQRRRRHETLSLDFAIGESGQGTLSDLIASETPCPAREAAASEFAALAVACAQRLNASHADILRRRNTLNQSYSRIGHDLGISVGTVKSRIGRARGSLRELIASAYPKSLSADSPLDWFEPVRPRGVLTAATG